ncbi:hypothetical protein [Billgrantia endophytica]|uniref:hypothetical protein n=1 Tax=Billgrantia endophytica TaxID=2033802 RepID=UPI001055801E|nr:hypothetical protein [Halomonas endophytica]
MARHDTHSSCRTMPSTAWPCRGLLVLLGLVVMLFSMNVAAHDATPDDTGHQLAGHASPQAGIALALDPHDGPHCHPGHGPQSTSYSPPRTERQDVKEPGAPHCLELTPPPRVMAVTGSPHGLPEASRLPIYLLTQRLRP